MRELYSSQWHQRVIRPFDTSDTFTTKNNGHCSDLKREQITLQSTPQHCRYDCWPLASLNLATTSTYIRKQKKVSGRLNKIEKINFPFLLASCLALVDRADSPLCARTIKLEILAFWARLFNGSQHQPMSAKKQTRPSCSLRALLSLWLTLTSDLSAER